VTSVARWVYYRGDSKPSAFGIQNFHTQTLTNLFLKVVSLTIWLSARWSGEWFGSTCGRAVSPWWPWPWRVTCSS